MQFCASKQNRASIGDRIHTPETGRLTAERMVRSAAERTPATPVKPEVRRTAAAYVAYSGQIALLISFSR